jgi:WD40 repeat protein
VHVDATRPEPTSEPDTQNPLLVRYDAFISYSHEADAAFASALQRGLQRLAKPWYRRRGMRIFRDETSLAAAPGLWPSIRAALDASDWFILLASPASANSAWVGKEIRHWVTTKGTDHLLVVLTSGTWGWSGSPGELSREFTAANPALDGVFPVEPKYVDMTWARLDSHLTVRNPRFRDQVATLAAAIRAVPKEDIEGEDIRQQRRTRRIVQAVIASLTALVVLASVLAVVANLQRDQAVFQRNVAISDQLSTQSEDIADSDPRLSRLLGLAAWDIHHSGESYDAMLTAAGRPGLAVLSSDTGAVNGVAFNRSGTVLATGSADGTVRLWDVATRRQIGAPLDPGSGQIHAVAFSPDGNTLATADADGNVRLWDAATHGQIGQPMGLGELSSAVSPVSFGFNVAQTVAFSPDGRTVAAGGLLEDEVWLFDARTQRQIGQPIQLGSPASVFSVAFSPDSRTLAIGTMSSTAQLWDVATRRRVWQAPTPAGGAAADTDAVAFSPDGSRLASVSNGTVHLLNTATSQPTGKPLGSDVGVVAFSPNGKLLAAGNGDGSIQLWNPATGGQLGIPITGHAARVESLAFSPNGTTLASGSDDGTARLWDTTMERSPTLPGTAGLSSFVSFLSDGSTLATTTADDTVQLWNPATGTSLSRASQPDMISDKNADVIAVSPDGTTAARDDQGTPRLWLVASHRTPEAIPIPAQSPGGGEDLLQSAAFSPSGTILATGSADGIVRLWDVATGQQITRLQMHSEQSVYSLAFNANGTELSAGGGDGSVWLWHVPGYRQLAGPLLATGSANDSISAVTFSRDGSTLAATSVSTGSIWLWDTATGQLARTLSVGGGSAYKLAFSPAGMLLAVGTANGDVQLWDYGSGQLITTLGGQADSFVSSLAFSADGNVLASSSRDNKTFNADGVLLWDLADLRNPVSSLCASVGQTLTRAEWARYVPPGRTYLNVCPGAVSSPATAANAATDGNTATTPSTPANTPVTSTDSNTATTASTPANTPVTGGTLAATAQPDLLAHIGPSIRPSCKPGIVGPPSYHCSGGLLFESGSLIGALKRGDCTADPVLTSVQDTINFGGRTYVVICADFAFPVISWGVKGEPYYAILSPRPPETWAATYAKWKTLREYLLP